MPNLNIVKKWWWLPVVLLLVPALVRADGMVIPKPMRMVTETGQRAVIWYEGNTETIILSTTFRGDAQEFAWIIPVPARPDVTAGKDELFTALDEYTRPKYSDNMPVPMMGAANMAIQDSYVGPKVTVLETKKVDIYETAVLEANDAGALSKWLTDNGYEYPANRDLLLKHYINKKWYFVAAKVSAEALGYAGTSLATGHATPLSITFASPQIVYPLKISGPGSKTVDGLVMMGHSFENGIGGWAGRGQVMVDAKVHRTSVGLSNTWAKHGKNSLKVTNAAGEPDDDYAFYSLYGLRAGETYTFSAYARAEKATTATAKLRLSEAGTYIAQSDEVGFEGGNLTKRLEVSFVSNGTTAKLELFSSDLKLSEAIYWDGVQVEKGEKATEFEREVSMPTTTQSDEYMKLVIYVFSNHKKYLPGWNTEYAGDVPVKDIVKMAINDDGNPWRQPKKSMYLTKLTRNMSQSEMTDDLTLRDADDNTAVGGGSGGMVGVWRPILVFGLLGGVELLALGYYWYTKSRKKSI
jgi:hypothetical protein